MHRGLVGGGKLALFLAILFAFQVWAADVNMTEAAGNTWRARYPDAQFVKLKDKGDYFEIHAQDPKNKEFTARIGQDGTLLEQTVRIHAVTDLPREVKAVCDAWAPGAELTSVSSATRKKGFALVYTVDALCGNGDKARAEIIESGYTDKWDELKGSQLALINVPASFWTGSTMYITRVNGKCGAHEFMKHIAIAPTPTNFYIAFYIQYVRGSTRYTFNSKADTVLTLEAKPAHSYKLEGEWHENNSSWRPWFTDETRVAVQVSK